MLDKGLLQSVFGADSSSTPSGYLLNEIANFSYTNDGNCLYLEDYLIKKLKKNDAMVKFKALRIIKYLCDRGNPNFKILIQRHANHIKYCQTYKGPFDPIYGDTLSELVREEAVLCIKSIFSNNSRNEGNINIRENNANFNTHNYKDRIHGFGNPNFIENNNNKDNMDISQIGNSIIYNAKMGHYNQIVEDLSDFVLKVIPNKLINGISNYCNNNYETNDNFSSYNSRIRKNNINNFFSNETIKEGSFAGPFVNNTNHFSGVKETSLEINTKIDLKNSESFDIINTNVLEMNFVENYCSTTGLILTPSAEQLQNCIKEILKLDIPTVLKLLHEKLVNYTIDTEKGEDILNIRNENSKVIYKILCLFLSLLEMNNKTKECLIKYSNSKFINLLSEISTTNAQFKRKVKQIIKILDTNVTECDLNISQNNLIVTSDLIDLSNNENKSNSKSIDLNIDNDDLITSINSSENLEKNKLFKNLSVKNHLVKQGASNIDNTEKLLIELDL